jgi:hypothetical protein
VFQCPRSWLATDQSTTPHPSARHNSRSRKAPCREWYLVALEVEDVEGAVVGAKGDHSVGDGDRRRGVGGEDRRHAPAEPLVLEPRLLLRVLLLSLVAVLLPLVVPVTVRPILVASPPGRHPRRGWSRRSPVLRRRCTGTWGPRVNVQPDFCFLVFGFVFVYQFVV